MWEIIEMMFKKDKAVILALTWVLTEMVWLLVFWGMMAAVCYFALNHLGATPSSAVMGSDSSTRQTTNGTTAATGYRFVVFYFQTCKKAQPQIFFIISKSVMRNSQ